MRAVFVSTCLLALFASQASGCVDQKSLLQMADLMPIIMGPTNDAVKSLCTSQTKLNSTYTKLNELVAACNNGNSQSVGSLFSLVTDTLCLQESAEGAYCSVGFVNMITGGDPMSLIPKMSDPTGLATLFRGQTSDTLKKACTSDVCAQKLMKKLVGALQSAAKSVGYKMDDPKVKQALDMTKDIASSCLVGKGKDEFCMETGKQYLDASGAPDKTKICDASGKITMCARRVISKYAPFMPTLPAQAVELCKAGAAAIVEKIATVKLTLKNLDFSYFEKNKDKLLNYIKNDLVFNAPGVLPGDIEAAVTKATDGKCVVDLTVSGAGDQRLDVLAMLNTLKTALAEKYASLPLLDSMNPEGTGVAEAQVQSDSASLEVTEITAPPTAVPPTSAPAGPASGSSSPTALLGLVAVLAAAAAWSM